MKRQQQTENVDEGKLPRLYYLAGRFITQQISPEEMEEISLITKEHDEDEEYAQTFVILTSTAYLKHFFEGMGIAVTLPELQG